MEWALGLTDDLFWPAGCDEMCPWDEVDLST